MPKSRKTFTDGISAMHTFDTLKKRHRQIREQFEQGFSIRIHRALSWLQRAEQEQDDPDAGFIFYWISFNANYAKDHHTVSFNEINRPEKLFDLLIKCDQDNQIYDLVWTHMSNEIRSILNNQYIFSSFWKMNNIGRKDGWQNSFESSKKTFNSAVAGKRTSHILQILFSRLYTLRNQLIHGSATWNGKVNRSQVKDGYNLIKALQPVFLSIMMNNPDKDWGDLAFPIVD